MESPILFACAVPGEHYHRDTGVIIRRDDDGDWMVTVPTRHGRDVAYRRQRFADARAAGADAVRGIRAAVAAAYTEAVAEEVDYAARRATAARGAGVLRGDAREQQVSGLTSAAADAYRRGELAPALPWAAEAVDLIDRLVAGRSRQRRAEGGRVREYREVTNCDLLTALLAVRGQDEAAAYLEDALRSRDHDAVVTAFDTAAYLSTAYVRNRPYRSEMSSIIAGRQSLVDDAHGEALNMDCDAAARVGTEADASCYPPVVLAVTEAGLRDKAARVDTIRDAWNRGVVQTYVAVRLIVEDTGVTTDGARALLGAESTAALA